MSLLISFIVTWSGRFFHRQRKKWISYAIAANQYQNKYSQIQLLGCVSVLFCFFLMRPLCCLRRQLTKLITCSLNQSIYHPFCSFFGNLVLTNISRKGLTSIAISNSFPTTKSIFFLLSCCTTQLLYNAHKWL